MIFYTHHLQLEAKKQGSDFISLIGNHELMNINRINEHSKNKELIRIISSRPIVLQINKSLFCHGIFKKQHLTELKYYKKRLNDINIIWTKFIKNEYITNVEKIILDNLVLDSKNSILFSKEMDTKIATRDILNDLNIDNIFIGHVKVKQIFSIFNIWFLDLYLKKAFTNKNYNNIIIKKDEITIIPLKENFYDNSYININNEYVIL